MKKLMIIWGLLTTMLFAPQLNAQVSVNININSQPAWGPVGYDYVEYYYLPDIEVYYSVVYQKYIYWNNGRWVWVTVLPSRYSYYNIYNGYKVVINEPNPYHHHHHHKVKYKGYKNYGGHQNVIRDVKGGRPTKGGWDSNLKKQAPDQKSTPKKGSGSTLKKQAPAKSTTPQKGSTLKKQAPTQQKSTPQKASPMKKQAPAKQPSSPQKASPLKKQAPAQQKPSSPQKSSPIKKQAPSQPSKSSPIKKAKGGKGN
jgi:hypothetical protein